MTDFICARASEGGCSGGHMARGMCNYHYQKWWRATPPEDRQGPTRIVKFWARVAVAGPDECWPWLGGKNRQGYGKTSLNGRHTFAHRVAFALAYLGGALPPSDVMVCHRCDNPPCCNPGHLLLGTAEDNKSDSMRKDRHARGERTNTAILSKSDVRDIRLDRRPQSVIAKHYGISKSTVGAIKTRVNWKHVR